MVRVEEVLESRSTSPGAWGPGGDRIKITWSQDLKSQSPSYKMKIWFEPVLLLTFAVNFPCGSNLKSTFWYIHCMGVPDFIVPIASNDKNIQVQICDAISKLGLMLIMSHVCVCYIGLYFPPNVLQFAENLIKISQAILKLWQFEGQ